MAARRRKLTTLHEEPQSEWQKDNAVPEALRPPVPHAHVKDYDGPKRCPRCFGPEKMRPVHTPGTQPAQTLNVALATAIAVVSAVVGAMFGGLALHP